MIAIKEVNDYKEIFVVAAAAIPAPGNEQKFMLWPSNQGINTVKKTALSVITLLTLSTQTLAQEPQKPFGIAIHGGAGTISKAKLTPQQIKAYKDKLRQGVEQGHAVLASGGTALKRCA